MKVALLFADDGSGLESAVLGPFRSAAFLECLRTAGVDPVLVFTEAGHYGDSARTHPLPTGIRAYVAGASGLEALLSDERPEAIETYGPEFRLSAIWPLAAATAPVIHCASSWPGDYRQADAASSAILTSSNAKRVRQASCRVAALLGTSRVTIGGWLAEGYFAGAAFSAVVAPPVPHDPAAAMSPIGEADHAKLAERHALVAAGEVPDAPSTVPAFGVHAPLASPELIASISHSVELTGRADAIKVRLAVENPPAHVVPGISFVTAGDIDGFVAGIDVLVVAAYDDSSAAVIISALRAGKSVIVPDRGGGAELIEYGRHGLMFCQGSPYHLANAMNIVTQSWGQKPVLSAHGGPAITRTDPDTVAAAMIAAWRRVAAAHPAGLQHGARVAAGG